MTDVKISKSHRTALFIAPASNSERVNRLLESLNGDNIKVDVYRPVATTSTVVQRVENDGNGVSSYGSDAAEFDVDAIRKEAAAAGYDQILFSVPA
jgi:hypothetical protein